ncbi:hypothetical protein [Devosia sp. A449]
MLFDPDQLPATTKTSMREKDEHYHRVVAVLNEKWRVIECCDGIQWIVQRRDKSTKTLATPRWRSVSYPRCREGVFAALTWLKIDTSDAAMARLVALPDWLHSAGANYLALLPGGVT